MKIWGVLTRLEENPDIVMIFGVEASQKMTEDIKNIAEFKKLMRTVKLDPKEFRGPDQNAGKNGLLSR